MEAYIGQIVCVGFNFAPVGWAICNGALLPISEYQPLFALIGTTYGGDGSTTFGLPDLRGRAPISQGHGPGLGNYVPGQSGGTESVTLTSQQHPTHSHPVVATNQAGTTNTPSPTVLLGQNTTPDTASLYDTTAPATTLSPNSTGAAGGSQPHENRQPYLAVNYIIALEGIFPSFN